MRRPVRHVVDCTSDLDAAEVDTDASAYCVIRSHVRYLIVDCDVFNARAFALPVLLITAHGYWELPRTLRSSHSASARGTYVRGT